MGLPNDAVRYIEAHSDETFELFKALSGIPAPSGQEEARAEFCLRWLYKNGVGQAYVDDAKNVVIPFGNCSKGAPVTAFLAHSDVVFTNTDPLPQRIEGDRFYVPGGGDNTIHVVHTLMAARYITHAGIKPSGAGVLLVINSGEEGLGNLQGCRKVMEDFATGMEALKLSVERFSAIWSCASMIRSTSLRSGFSSLSMSCRWHSFTDCFSSASGSGS